MSKARLKSLFLKIGGEKKLEEILVDFYQRMSQDILIGYFFTGKDITQIAHRQKDFLLFASGIKATYTGKSPTSAHLELPPILKGHFNRRLVLLKATLKDHGLTEQDIKTWIGFESSFRKVIVK